MIQLFLSILIFMLLVTSSITAVILLIFYIRKLANQTKLTFKSVFRIYLYVISFVTVVISVLSMILLINSVTSLIFGPEFGYRLDAYYEETENVSYNFGNQYEEQEQIEVDGKTYLYDGRQAPKDLVNYSILFVFSGIIYLTHRYGIYATRQGFADESDLLRKLYVFSLLLTFGIAAVILIPGSINTIVNYLVLGVEDFSSSTYNPPGEGISVLLVSIPAWSFLVFRAVGIIRAENTDGKKSIV